MYRIGVDVGGTNTDAVIMQGDTAGIKSPTTEDVMTGVVSCRRRSFSGQCRQNQG